ncbi:MAG: NAD-dependent protein deacylase [Lachnospiraceae bacterium]
MSKEIEELNRIIKESKKIVFFGGAGVSTESGIPDFRSVDGLYHQSYEFPPETILSHTFYKRHTEEFYDFYRNRMLYLDAKPNAAHMKLARLEGRGKLTAIVTQNIDGLHQAAGSKHVLELHGSVHRNYCTKCNALYSAKELLEGEGIPKCSCGGIIKPDVVLYEEALNQKTMIEAIAAIQEADTLIVGGTSLSVYPAAGMIDYFHGKHLILINKTATEMDQRAELVIQEGIASVFSKVED